MKAKQLGAIGALVLLGAFLIHWSLGADRREVEEQHQLGLRAQGRKDYVLATREHEAALALAEERLDVGDPLFSSIHRDLGICYEHKLDRVGALRHYELAVAAYRAQGDAEDRDLAVVLESAGRFRAQKGQYKEALPLFREAYYLFKRAYGPDDNPFARDTRNYIAKLCAGGHRAACPPPE